jgi:hypothetical protein
MDNRGPGAEDGNPGTVGGGQKTGGGKQERTADDERAAREAAPPNNRTCYYCAYAQWMRPGLSALMTTDWLHHLMCVNHPDAPGTCREVLPAGTCPNFRARWKPPLRVEPPEPPNDEVRYIALSRGKYTVVDAADFEWLNRHKWFAIRSPHGPGCYAARWDGKRIILMHREIMNAPDGTIVDHANRCPSDNRQCNLRLCTHQQNTFNRRCRAHTSQYQGVSYSKDWGQWVAHIKLDAGNEHLGHFDDEVAAAKVRDRWAFAFHRRFAFLNFPEDFEGKDPDDPEFQAIRDYLQEKRRKREARKKAKEERQKERGQEADTKRRGRRKDQPQAMENK